MAKKRKRSDDRSDYFTNPAEGVVAGPRALTPVELSEIRNRVLNGERFDAVVHEITLRLVAEAYAAGTFSGPRRPGEPEDDEPSGEG